MTEMLFGIFLNLVKDIKVNALHLYLHFAFEFFLHHQQGFLFVFSFCLFFSNIIVIYICWSKYIPVLNVIVKCYCDMKSKYVYIDRGKNTLGSILRTDLVSVVSFFYKSGVPKSNAFRINFERFHVGLSVF